MTEKTPLSNTARATLRDAVKKVEELRDEAANISAELSGVYRDAKAAGLDTKVIKRVVQLRAMEPAKRAEFESLVDLYEAATKGA